MLSSPDLRRLLRAPTDVDLSEIDTRATTGLPDLPEVRRDRKGWARSQLLIVGEELAALQERLFAEQRGGGRRRVLMVLQAMDGGGKDGTVRRVGGSMNPQGLRVVSFGAPTREELEHDFLWRIRRELPGPGMIGIFNRSHYEDVLIARVHDLVPPEVWERRYAEIDRFEAELAADGVTILKVMLHISREEQAKRLTERLTDPAKHWKYDPGDLAERAHWDDYQRAYEAALTRCNPDTAPWYVVPADRKWYRDWAVAHLLRATLAELGPALPKPSFDPAEELRKLRAVS